MTEIDSKKFDLLKKLHALAHDKAATEAEAATAMSKMQKLLLELNLSVSDINMTADQHVEEIRQGRGDVLAFALGLYGNRRIRANALQWMVDLASAVARNNFGRILVGHQNSYVVFVGKPHNIEAMKEIWMYLMSQVSHLALDAYKVRVERDIDGRLWMRNFCLGATSRLARRMREDSEREAQASVDTKALMVVNDAALTEYMEQFKGAARHNTGKRTSGYREGFEAGGKVNIGRKPAQVRS